MRTPTSPARPKARATAARRSNGRRSNGRRSSAPRVPFALLVGGLLVGGLVLLLALNTGSAANELRRSALAGKDQEVSADVAELRNQVAASAAPGNLATAAEQLGMVPAGHPAFIVVLPNGKTVLRGHARPVTDDPLDIPSGTKHASPAPTTRAAAKTSAARTSAAPKSSSSSSSSPSSRSGTARHKLHHPKHRSGRTTSAAPTTSNSPTGGRR